MLDRNISMDAKTVFIACSLMLLQALYRVASVVGDERRDQKTAVTMTGKVNTVDASSRWRNWSGRGQRWRG